MPRLTIDDLKQMRDRTAGTLDLRAGIARLPGPAAARTRVPA